MPQDLMLVLSRQLSALRLAQHLSQEEVAHRAGISVPTYRRLEQFSHGNETGPNPHIGTVMRALRVLRADDVVVRAVEDALAARVGYRREDGGSGPGA